LEAKIKFKFWILLNMLFSLEKLFIIFILSNWLGSFDFIISLAVVEHIQNPDNFFQNAMRCLKKDGLIYLTTPNFTYCYESFYDDYTHVKPYTAESLRYILDTYNFEKINILPGLRCKPKWYYTGKLRFWIAAKLIPFTNNYKILPSILKGKATSLIGIAKKKK